MVSDKTIRCPSEVGSDGSSRRGAYRGVPRRRQKPARIARDPMTTPTSSSHPKPEYGSRRVWATSETRSRSTPNGTQRLSERHGRLHRLSFAARRRDVNRRALQQSSWCHGEPFCGNSPSPDESGCGVVDASHLELHSSEGRGAVCQLTAVTPRSMLSHDAIYSTSRSCRPSVSTSASTRTVRDPPRFSL